MIVFMFEVIRLIYFLDADLNVKKTVPEHLGAEQTECLLENNDKRLIFKPLYYFCDFSRPNALIPAASAAPIA